MRVANLLDLTNQTGASTGPVFNPFRGKDDRVIRGTGGLATFKLSDAACSCRLEGSIDGVNFVNIKTVTRTSSGSDVLEGHSIAIFPHMRGKVTSASIGADIKLDIAFE